MDTILPGLLAIINTLINKLFNPRPRQPIERSGEFGEAVLDWINLSQGARRRLGQSKFIKIGGTRDALTMLVNSAKDDDTILAICGYKGDYSEVYYKANFKKCKAVRRVFSYEAIRSEIKVKNEHYALEGLKMHLNKKVTNECDVEVFLIPKGKRIKDLRGGSFDPPFSFGLAILQDGNHSPKMAIMHWEMDAEPLKHLIAIEGVLIDEGQKELLHELVKLHESIANSNKVLTSRKAPKTFVAVCNELEKFWKSHHGERERKR